MKLKRLGFYRITRVLSWVLPVIIFAFVFIAAWSYLGRTRNGQAVARTDMETLPPGLQVSTDGVQYFASEADRNIFLIKGRRMLSFDDNRTVLEDVEVLIYSRRQGEPDRHIRGAECSHDRLNNHIVCNRNVTVELEPGTIADTDQLIYDHIHGTISSPVHTSLSREGEMNGDSGGMEYFVNTGLMRLTNTFEIRLNRGGGMSGGNAVFQARENWATVSEGVELTSGNGRIHGEKGRAELLPGTYRPKKVTVEGGAGAEAPSFDVNSDWLQTDLSDAGDIEHVIGRGNVRAERRAGSTSGAGNGNSLDGTLTGPEVETWLEGGNVKVVEARQQPHFESSSSGTLDAADTIRIEPAGLRAGSVRTRGTSKFTREGLNIEGSNFTIDMKDDDHEQIFNTTSRATLKAAGLTTNANTTTARFDTKAKTLTSMVQTGAVTFSEEKGGRSGSSEKLTVRDGGDRVEMEDGNPRFVDAQGTLNASKITLDRKRESFVGEGRQTRIRMISAEADKPVVIFARRVEGQLGGESPRVDYSGDVEMYPPDHSQIKATNLTIFPKEKRFEAEGKLLRTVSPSGQIVDAQRLEFADSANGPQVAHYTGNVTVVGDFPAPGAGTQKSDKRVHLSLQSNDLKLHSKEGNLEMIVATGDVRMDQGTQRGRGVSMDYNVQTGATHLRGTSTSPAEISGGTERSLKGCMIELAADGKRTATNCANEKVITTVPIEKK
jgi:lipopolysaccharide export system protein LptA